MSQGKNEPLTNTHPADKLIQIVTGAWTSKLIYLAAKLGIADLLKDNPKDVEELARATDTHAPSLHRILRALASIGVFEEIEPGRFTLNPAANLLQSDVAGSLRAFAIMVGDDWHWRVWEDVLYSVKTGLPNFDRTFGMLFFDYMNQNPEAGKIFDDAMTGVSLQLSEAVAAAYDFSQIKSIVDVGGGNGILLAKILKANPHLRGTLFDLPNVIERAKRQKYLETAELNGRYQYAAGNFFELSTKGADAYILKNVIHNWDDDHATVILKNCREAIPENGKLLLVEYVIPSGNDPYFGKILDIEMLVMATGRERTKQEFEELYQAAGFKLSRIIATQTPVFVIEGTPTP
jgi:ubiquinone/menaquinone biosynthesis C-methylase UbiE